MCAKRPEILVEVNNSNNKKPVSRIPICLNTVTWAVEALLVLFLKIILPIFW